MLSEDFTNALNRLMQQKSVSGYRLSQITGLSKSYIYRLMNGENKSPKANTLQKIGHGLGVSEDYMYKMAGLRNGSDDEAVVKKVIKDGHPVFRFNGQDISEEDWKVFEPILKKFIERNKNQ